MGLLANIGVPMIGAYWPPAWLAFVPVVAIEAWWARRILANGWTKAIGSAFVANAVSTVVGIPLIWFLWAVIQVRYLRRPVGLDSPAKGLYSVTVEAAWLGPYREELRWMLPCAAVALTVVLCVASIMVERLVMKIMQGGADASSLWRWAWKGNVCSYVLILGFVIAFLYVPRDSLDRIAGTPVRFMVDLVFRTDAMLRP